MNNNVLVNRYLAYLRQERRSVNSLSAYATDLKQLTQYLGSHKFIQLNRASLLDFCSLLVKEMATNTQARKLTTVREFLLWSYQNGYLKSDLAQEIRLPRRATRKPTTPLSPSQITRLRRKADVVERLLLELLLQTGMRLAEVVLLRMKELSLEKAVIQKPSSEIRIPITDPLSQALEYYLAAFSRGPRSYLLISPRTGRELTTRTASNHLSRLSRRAGVRGVTPRNLRVTFIGRQLQAGVPLVTIQEIVGHRTPTTTQKYLKHVKNSKKQKMKVLIAV